MRLIHGCIHDVFTSAPNNDSPSGDNRAQFAITKEDFVSAVLKNTTFTELKEPKMPQGIIARQPQAEITSNEKTSFGDIVITNLCSVNRHTGKPKHAGVGIVYRMTNGKYKFAMNGAGKCTGGTLAAVLCRNSQGGYDAFYVDAQAKKELLAWMDDERTPRTQTSRRTRTSVIGINMADPSIDGNYLLGRYGEIFRAAMNEKSLEKAQLLGIVRVDGPDKDSQEVIAQKYHKYCHPKGKVKKAGPMVIQEYAIVVPDGMAELYKIAQEVQAAQQVEAHKKEVRDSVAVKYTQDIDKARKDMEKRIAEIEDKMAADTKVQAAQKDLEKAQELLESVAQKFREKKETVTA